MIMTDQRKPVSSGVDIKPRITLMAKDYERLLLLARAVAVRMPEVASILAEELDRAHVLADQDSGRSVCMGSVVEFRDDTTGKVQTVTLVYPGDADISQRKISVLTPVGTALIGLGAGDCITWETRTGESRQLTVLKVDEAGQSEAGGIRSPDAASRS
jgi:regulator of nucleoside diphosphate kinase